MSVFWTSELVVSEDVKDMSMKQISICDIETARTPLSDIRCKNNILNAESIVDQASSHRGLNPAYERIKMARMYPLSDVGCDSDALNFNVDIFGEMPRHPDPGSADTREVARNLRDDDVKSNDFSPGVDSDISSTLEKITFDNDIDQEDTNHIARAVSQSDDNCQLYTLVNGVTGVYDGTASHEAITS